MKPTPTTTPLIEGIIEEFERNRKDKWHYLDVGNEHTKEILNFLLSSLQKVESENYKLITELNGMLRSAYSIAQREGKTTNWEGFSKQVKLLLEKTRNYY